ncbi:unnamed protein product [Acanthoscelides obtectus]|uniref:C2H2-type domain-containing protein n=1 Tax=Acanthoscelides obtectus TaxID=200917 RepID=A0A9P0PQ94_ACAOB|nr:unnamed protein product [Acanthoscelides obtectus]CAK1675651.1 Zinc finger and BTB domain-containing protein 40 [Acanthoscelides obtectus]
MEQSREADVKNRKSICTINNKVLAPNKSMLNDISQNKEPETLNKALAKMEKTIEVDVESEGTKIKQPRKKTTINEDLEVSNKALNLSKSSGVKGLNETNFAGTEAHDTTDEIKLTEVLSSKIVVSKDETFHAKKEGTKLVEEGVTSQMAQDVHIDAEVQESQNNEEPNFEKNKTPEDRGLSRASGKADKDEISASILTCKTCTKTFSSEDSLKCHANATHAQYNCTHCQYMFFDEHSLQEHFSQKHKDIWTCALCKTNVDCEDDLLLHYRNSHAHIVNESKVWNCKKCNGFITNEKEIEKHLMSKHAFKDNTCPICDKGFLEENLVMDHFKEIHIATITKPSCAVCKLICANESHLVLHYLEKHKDRDQLESKGVVGKAPEIMAQSDPSSLEVVRLIQAKYEAELTPSNKNKKFECFICLMKLKRDVALVAHLRESHNLEVLPPKGEDKRWFLCPKCDNKYDTKELAQQHVRKEHADNFRCMSCLSYFAYQEHLKKHEESRCTFFHRDGISEEYSCRYCERIMPQKRLTAHLTRCLLNGRRCTYCLDFFDNENDLDTHMNIRHPDQMKKLQRRNERNAKRVFPCPMCKKKFTSQEAVITHAQPKHPAIQLGDGPFVPLESVVTTEYNYFKCLFCSHSRPKISSIVVHITKAHKNDAYKLSDCVTLKLYNQESGDSPNKSSSGSGKNIGASSNSPSKSLVIDNGTPPRPSVAAADSLSLKGAQSIEEDLSRHPEQENEIWDDETQEALQAVSESVLCPMCKKDCESKKDMLYHARRHHPAIRLGNCSPVPLKSLLVTEYVNEKLHLRCPFCPEFLRLLPDVVDHIRKEHRYQANQMSNCVTLGLYDPEAEVSLHEDDNRFQDCSSPGPSSSFQGPSLSSDSGEWCGFCFKSFENQELRRSHENMKHPEQMLQLKRKVIPSAEIPCPICKKAYKTKEGIFQHAKSNHPAIQLGNDPPVPLESVLLTVYKNEKALLKCPFCIKCFKVMSLVTQHINRSHKDKGPMSDCITLGLYEKVPGDVDDFFAAEPESGPTLCPICKRAFKSNQTLKIHALDKHPAVKLRSGSAVPLESSITTKSEAGKIYYECPFCILKYPKKDVVKGHILKQHEDQVFDCVSLGLYEEQSEEDYRVTTCPICGMNFNSEARLIDHAKTIHPAIRLEDGSVLPLEEAIDVEYIDRKIFYHCPFCNHRSRSRRLRDITTHIYSAHRDRKHQMLDCVSIGMFDEDHEMASHHSVRNVSDEDTARDPTFISYQQDFGHEISSDISNQASGKEYDDIEAPRSTSNLRAGVLTSVRGSGISRSGSPDVRRYQKYYDLGEPINREYRSDKVLTNFRGVSRLPDMREQNFGAERHYYGFEESRYRDVRYEEVLANVPGRSTSRSRSPDASEQHFGAERHYGEYYGPDATRIGDNRCKKFLASVRGRSVSRPRSSDTAGETFGVGRSYKENHLRYTKIGIRGDEPDFNQFETEDVASNWFSRPGPSTEVFDMARDYKQDERRFCDERRYFDSEEARIKTFNDGRERSLPQLMASRVSSADREEMFKCHVCGSVYLSYPAFDMHMKINHKREYVATGDAAIRDQRHPRKNRKWHGKR